MVVKTRYQSCVTYFTSTMIAMPPAESGIAQDDWVSDNHQTGDRMESAPTALEQLKQRMRSTWMAGDFGQIAQYWRRAAEEFVARLGIKPAASVLDVACGTGNLAISAGADRRQSDRDRHRSQSAGAGATKGLHGKSQGDFRRGRCRTVTLCRWPVRYRDDNVWSNVRAVAGICGR